MTEALDTGDVLTKCNAARSYLAGIKHDFDKAHQLRLGARAALAMQELTECITELNAQREFAVCGRCFRQPVLCRGDFCSSCKLAAMDE